MSVGNVILVAKLKKYIFRAEFQRKYVFYWNICFLPNTFLTLTSITPGTISLIFKIRIYKTASHHMFYVQAKLQVLARAQSIIAGVWSSLMYI